MTARTAGKDGSFTSQDSRNIQYTKQSKTLFQLNTKRRRSVQEENRKKISVAVHVLKNAQKTCGHFTSGDLEEDV